MSAYVQWIGGIIQTEESRRSVIQTTIYPIQAGLESKTSLQREEKTLKKSN